MQMPNLIRVIFLSSIAGFGLLLPAFAESPRILDGKLHHLRMEGAREWDDFPEVAESESLLIHFDATENDEPATLQLRQQDVKQKWAIILNGSRLGTLSTDANDTVLYYDIPTKGLRQGKNELKIEQVITKRSQPDDIRIGQIILHRQPREKVLGESTLEIDVIDTSNAHPIPCRLTIVRPDGALPSLGTVSNSHLAIRPGVVYTSTGRAKISLPAGNYNVFAGRGFEYSIDQASITLQKGENVRTELKITREVPTQGYVACDTHVHTFTYSRHGDCSIEERMLTLAGEGIEFPIATDHNQHIDYIPSARQAHVLPYFTPVIGNEVTTKLGHFNIFPIAKGAPIPNYNTDSWAETFREINKVPDVKIIILNHARDIHAGTRPFGPKLYNEAVGVNLEGWKLEANAMEIINSGATQTDPLQLTRDWMTQLNRGNYLTPVGCSDSHDVNRYIVGQGRTYIRCNDTNPGKINRETAILNFLQGRVLVSYGLIAEMKINETWQSGDLVPVSENASHVTLNLRVLGPSWIRADRIQLYANGQLVREETIGQRPPEEEGVIWTGKWKYNIPSHDVHLVAVATGPGIKEPFWKTARPYQPTSPHFESRLIGCSGAIWIDGDHDRQKTSASGYAQKVFEKCKENINSIMVELKNDDADAAIAAQVAYLYQQSGNSLLSEECVAALKNASPATQKGFRNYFEAWRKTLLARKSQ